MSDKLQQFEKELRDQHAALTKAFRDAQVEAEAKWAVYEAKKKELVEFNAQYGRVLMALDAKAVTVAEKQ